MDETCLQSLERFQAGHPPRTLSFRGFRWEYLVCGTGEETVLFLHGLAGSADIWWRVISALENHYRSIAVTYPPVERLADLAAGINAVLDEAGVEKVNLVGTSLGGYLAQYLVKTCPERIRRAVFSNTYAHPEPLARKYRLAGLLLPIAPEPLVRAVLQAGFSFLIYPSSGRSKLTLAYLRQQASRKMSKADVLSRYHNVLEPFEPADPSSLKIPVLIVESDNDPLIEPGWRESLKARYPSACVTTLRGGGHFPYLSMPEVYIRVLEDFFSMEPQPARPAETLTLPR
jgi:pimeloyl-ACP methyl ester carboxylesterase